MEKVLITGASGLIGTELSIFLKNRGFEISHLSRGNTNKIFHSYKWNLNKGFIEAEALENVDYIIHLAGAGIADKRWTEQRKKEIIDSRVKSAELLFNKISNLNSMPKAFISASAIGYYGAITSNKIFQEDDLPSNDFQGKICKLWEQASIKFEELGIRTVQLRFGIVLSQKGGALKKMLLPTKLGFGSALGSGKQYFPWVHIKDVLGIIEKCMTDEKMKHAYNVVAPSFNNYDEFAKTLAKVLNKPFLMPNVPSFVLKLLFGEMSEIILEGSRISSEKIQSAGFNFEYTNLEIALKSLLR